MSTVSRSWSTVGWPMRFGRTPPVGSTGVWQILQVVATLIQLPCILQPDRFDCDVFLGEVHWNPVTAVSFTCHHEHIIDTSNWKQIKQHKTKVKAWRLYKNKVKYLKGQVWSTALWDTIKSESTLKGMCMNLTSQILNTLWHQIILWNC